MSKYFAMIEETDVSVFKQKCQEAIRESGRYELVDADYIISPPDQHLRHTYYAFFVFDSHRNDV